MRWLILLITSYQKLFRPWLAPRCRFYPSCSDYALEALQRFGPFHGGWLASKRLIKCHPLNPGGVDLVPPRCRPHPSSH